MDQTPNPHQLNWPRLIPHAKQLRALRTAYIDDGTRTINIVAGRGSGKSETACRWTCFKLLRRTPHPDPRYFYAADTAPHARDICWERMLSLFPAQWIAGKPRESLDGLGFRTIFGSSFHCFGLFRGTRRSLPIEGRQWDGGIVDESSDIPPGVVDKSIRPALVWRQGCLWRIGVPKRHGVGAAEFREAWERGDRGEDPNTISLHWTSSEIVPAELLIDAQRRLDAKDYREQFDATWETDTGSVFWAFSSESNIRPCTYDSNLPLIIACDFNVNPMCWAIGHQRGRLLEWVDEIFLRDANTPATLGVLWGRYSHHRGGFVFVGDASGHARKTAASQSDYAWIETDKRFNESPGGSRILVPPSNPPINDRFAATNAMFCNAAGERRMYIDPHCTRIVEDITMRTHGIETNKDRTHMSDAVGYAVWVLYGLAIGPASFGVSAVRAFLPPAHR